MILIPIFILYQFFTLLAFPWIITAIAYTNTKRAIVGNLAHRLGWVPQTASDIRSIWIHTVSVGETLAIESLVAAIRADVPEAKLYHTVGTITGMDIASKKIASDYRAFLAYDFLPCMLLAFARIKPQAIILVEAELWPNLIMLARLKNIPIYQLNARISARSQARFKRLSGIVVPLLNCFKTFFVQNEQEQQRFAQLGVAPEKLVIQGDLKAYNVVEKVQENTTKQHISAPYKILLVGSVHPGELAVYLDLFSRIKKSGHAVKMIIVPRHLTWQPALETMLREHELSYVVWSDSGTRMVRQAHHERLCNKNQSKDSARPELVEGYERIVRDFTSHDIIAVCTIGMLFSLYRYADIYFLGGTFVPVGGHNLLEPCVWHTPTIIGPAYHTITNVVDQLVACNGITIAHNPEQLHTLTTQLLINPRQATYQANQAYAWIQKEHAHVRNTIAQFIAMLKHPNKR